MNFYSILIISTCMSERNKRLYFFGNELFRNVVKSMLFKIQPIPQTNILYTVCPELLANSETSLFILNTFDIIFLEIKFGFLYQSQKSLIAVNASFLL